MTRLEAYGEVKDGKLHIIHSDMFKKAIETLPKGRYRLTLEKVYRKRSNPQNAFYHGVCIPLILQGLRDNGFLDMDPEKTHELLKFKFLKKRNNVGTWGGN